MTEPTKPSISTHHENNFTTLCEAVRNGDVCLMLCTDAKTGEHATVLCIVNEGIDPDTGEEAYEMLPVATMIEGNPFEAYIPPNGEAAIFDQEDANNVSPTTEHTTH